MKISQIIDKIDEQQLFVPAFQREYVWKRAHAKKLIDSLIKDSSLEVYDGDHYFFMKYADDICDIIENKVKDTRLK